MAVLPPGMVVGSRYQIEVLVSEAPTHHEYLALDRFDHRQVALWLPDDKLAVGTDAIRAAISGQRGLTEVGARRMLSYGIEPLFIVCDAATAQGPQPGQAPHAPEVVAAWIEAVAAVLAAAYVRKLHHGALTSRDVVVIDGALQVGGLALWRRVEAAQLVAAFGLCASELAPEVRAGKPTGPAADLWAMGMIAARLVVGNTPDPLAALARWHPGLHAVLAPLGDPDSRARPRTTVDLAQAARAALRTPYAAMAPRPRSPSPATPVAEAIEELDAGSDDVIDELPTTMRDPRRPQLPSAGAAVGRARSDGSQLIARRRITEGPFQVISMMPADDPVADISTQPVVKLGADELAGDELVTRRRPARPPTIAPLVMAPVEVAPAPPSGRLTTRTTQLLDGAGGVPWLILALAALVAALTAIVVVKLLR